MRSGMRVVTWKELRQSLLICSEMAFLVRLSYWKDLRDRVYFLLTGKLRIHHLSYVYFPMWRIFAVVIWRRHIIQ